MLLADDGATINFPRRLLPKNASAGDILGFAIERDTAAAKQVAEATRKLQDDLKKTDTGGDIKI